jgi:predicted phosphate transport protein (TIGR00153 family)
VYDGKVLDGKKGFLRSIPVTFPSFRAGRVKEEESFMAGLLAKILPSEKSFFKMFNQQAENVEAGAIAMVEMLEHFDDASAGAEKVESFEHIGDTITHNIMMRLNQTFITPFDREDIHELASKIDDVIDLMDAAATRMVIYRIDSVRPGVLELAKTVRDATAQIVAAVRVLEKGDHILDHCIEINRLENLADHQCRGLIGTLFDQEKDPVQIIKWKEIIETLEFATDKCEDVANVIETVTLKNA